MLINNTIIIILAIVGAISLGVWGLYCFQLWTKPVTKSAEDSKIEFLEEYIKKLEEQHKELRYTNKELLADYHSTQDNLIKKLLDT